MKSNVLYEGDNLEIMRSFESNSIDLIYIDPPFFTQTIRKQGDIEFSDKWKGGIESYLEWIRERIIEIHRVLKETGSFFLHCDYRTSYDLRTILNSIFKKDNFKNHIIWKKNSPKGARSISKQFGRQFDEIFFYSKDKLNSKFYNQYIARDLNHRYNPFKYRDKKGRLYSRNCPVGDYSKESIKNFEKKGRIYTSKKGIKMIIRYFDEVKGIIVSDLWGDVSPLNNVSKERVGYPTQKPLALLNRIIKCSTNKGDLVLDSFCGSGTTLSSAHSLQRRWIGIDNSKDAIEITKKRMKRDHNLEIEIMKRIDLSNT